MNPAATHPRARFYRLSLALLSTLLLLYGDQAIAQKQTQPLTRIVFGSCAGQDSPQPIWKHIVEANPELFLFIGDNIYADTEDMNLMRAKYAKLAAVPGYRKLLESCPVLANWDDHDYGANDAGAEYPRRAESQQILLDFFGEPRDSARRTREGVYDAKVFGPPGKQVEIILLDTSYFRSPLRRRKWYERGSGPYLPNMDRSTPILGEAQWKWLAEQIRVPAQVRIIVSSIQVIPADHG